MNIHWLLLIIYSYSTSAYFVDYTENTELIQQRTGYDVKLQCNLKGIIDERKLAEIKIHWYFKQCTDNNCFVHIDESDWTALPCDKNFCKSELLLHNVTENYSGLYKCTVYPHPYQSFDIQLVRTYQLDVKNTLLAVPEFLDSYPSNKTAVVDAQVVFQCRVHSGEHPTTIKWFRRIPQHSPTSREYASTLNQGSGSIVGGGVGGGNFSAHIVRYNGRTYELLPTAPEKLVSEQIYLSKLLLNGVRARDEGFYACVAISFRGHKIREAYLQVVAPPPKEETEYWLDYDERDESNTLDHTDPKEFWLLFLMPVALAMLPLTVWFCYVTYKRCTQTADICHDIEDGDDVVVTVDTDRCMLRR